MGLLLVCMLGGTFLARAAEGRPNIILIISDDHAWTDYSFMGHPNIRTPNLDRLAAEGLCFPRGYVPASLCCPSLASIMTGRYPHEHKIANNDPPLPAGPRAQVYATPAFKQGRDRMNQFMDALPTLPRLLTGHGYLTFQSGKWWQGNFQHGGFTHGMTRGEAGTGSGRHGDEGLKIGRETMQPVFDFMDLARREQKPFFVWYAPMMPHDPHTPPERLLAKYRTQTNSLPVARYWAMVEWFDETCGQLLNYLERNHLSTNTVIAYVADNGWIQSPNNPRYAPKSKQSQYDGGLRTPILVRWPARIKPLNSPALASSLDLLPTLLKAAQIEAPAGLPGINLLNPAAVQTRTQLFGACFTHDAVDLEHPEKSLRFRWSIQEEWKIIVPDLRQETNGVTELYHLGRDPFETNNLAGREPARTRTLQATVDRWWTPR
jgi:uncharacterized sulfatase